MWRSSSRERPAHCSPPPPADASPMLTQLRAADVPWYVTSAEQSVEGAVAIDEQGLTELLEGAEVVLRY